MKAAVKKRVPSSKAPAKKKAKSADKPGLRSALLAAAADIGRVGRNGRMFWFDAIAVSHPDLAYEIFNTIEEWVEFGEIYTQIPSLNRLCVFLSDVLGDMTINYNQLKTLTQRVKDGQYQTEGRRVIRNRAREQKLEKATGGMPKATGRSERAAGSRPEK